MIAGIIVHGDIETVIGRQKTVARVYIYVKAHSIAAEANVRDRSTGRQCFVIPHHVIVIRYDIRNGADAVGSIYNDVAGNANKVFFIVNVAGTVLWGYRTCASVAAAFLL